MQLHTSTCLALLVFSIARVSTAAAPPPVTTFAQLAHDEKKNPDYYDSGTSRYNMDKRIPRDFPIPLGSRDLHYSNALPAAGVSGVTPAVAAEFYLENLPRLGWNITETVSLPGLFSTVACKKNECVNLHVQSQEHSPSHPNVINFLFFPKR